MSEGLIIKNFHFGIQKPIICVPIVEKSVDAILYAAKQLKENHVEMIEWRIDWFEEYSDINKIIEVLDHLSKQFTDNVLLCTYRSKEQGGQGNLDIKSYEAMLICLADSKKADMIDLEFYRLNNPKYYIDYIKKANNFVIASNHNFTETPNVENMTQQLILFQQSGADIAKLAVMPNNNQDVLNLLQATVNMKNSYPESNIITMSMGTEGIVSRLTGEIFGSCVTFASFEKPSAPGQMQVADVEFILNKIHERYEGKNEK